VADLSPFSSFSTSTDESATVVTSTTDATGHEKTSIGALEEAEGAPPAVAQDASRRTVAESDAGERASLSALSPFLSTRQSEFLVCKSTIPQAQVLKVAAALLEAAVVCSAAGHRNVSRFLAPPTGGTLHCWRRPANIHSCENRSVSLVHHLILPMI
jgi:hypothetical protein